MDVNAQDKNKWTPLHLASKGGRVKFVQMLIENGANVEVWNEYQGTRLDCISLIWRESWNSLARSLTAVRM